MKLNGAVHGAVILVKMENGTERMGLENGTVWLPIRRDCVLKKLFCHKRRRIRELQRLQGDAQSPGDQMVMLIVEAV